MADIQHSIQAAKPQTVYHLIASEKGFGKWWATGIAEPGHAVEPKVLQRATVYRLRLTPGKAPLQAEWICEMDNGWTGSLLAEPPTSRGTGGRL
jgi:hypothetical protein